MSAQTRDIYAFPCAGAEGVNPESLGMSLRSYFAIHALQGLLSNYSAQQKICDTDPRYAKQPDGQFNFSQVMAINAVEFADALIEQLGDSV